MIVYTGGILGLTAIRRILTESVNEVHRVLGRDGELQIVGHSQSEPNIILSNNFSTKGNIDRYIAFIVARGPHGIIINYEHSSNAHHVVLPPQQYWISFPRDMRANEANRLFIAKTCFFFYLVLNNLVITV